MFLYRKPNTKDLDFKLVLYHLKEAERGVYWNSQLPSLPEYKILFSVQFSSVQLLSHVWLCDPMNCSTAGFPVHHQLPEFAQTHVHRVGDAIQPSYPLSSPSPPDHNPSQYQSSPMSQLFTWGGQSTGVSALASFLPKNTQGWSPLEWTGWTSLQSIGSVLISFFCM